MTDQHPITPPPELVREWIDRDQGGPNVIRRIAARAAQWGSDQELEACCKWLVKQGWFSADEHEAIEELRAARRPKPPSLKEQALAVLESVAVHELCGDAEADNRLSADDMGTIRRALEQIDD